MTNNNWIEEFDEKFYNNDSNQDCGWLCDMMQGGDKCDAIKDFISNLLTQKDQEHKAELERIVNFIDKNYLEYCRQQNGMDYCKNCGLNKEDIIKSTNTLTN